jgi:hypothetical protein
VPRRCGRQRPRARIRQSAGAFGPAVRARRPRRSRFRCCAAPGPRRPNGSSCSPSSRPAHAPSCATAAISRPRSSARSKASDRSISCCRTAIEAAETGVEHAAQRKLWIVLPDQLRTRSRTRRTSLWTTARGSRPRRSGGREALARSVAQPAQGEAEGPFEIAEVVARIDAFWRDREEDRAAPVPGTARAEDFRFETDAKGIVRWVAGVSRAAIVGISLDLPGKRRLAASTASLRGVPPPRELQHRADARSKAIGRCRRLADLRDPGVRSRQWPLHRLSRHCPAPAHRRAGRADACARLARRFAAPARP